MPSPRRQNPLVTGATGLSVGLVGGSGFVGTTIARQCRVDRSFRSTDAHEIVGCHFDMVVVAAAPGHKWLANRDPEADRENLATLMGHLGGVTTERLVLVSTVDVFGDPIEVDEGSEPGGSGTSAYGLNRLALERFVQERFRATIVRLPGLVGPGLRKNAIHDLAHRHELDRLDARAVFQFYPMVNLWSDVRRTLDLDLGLVHLTAAPVQLGAIAESVFDIVLESADGPVVRYDLRSRHAREYGGGAGYQYSRRETELALRCYCQSEPAGAA